MGSAGGESTDSRFSLRAGVPGISGGAAWDVEWPAPLETSDAEGHGRLGMA